jgi:MFS family permease
MSTKLVSNKVGMTNKNSNVKTFSQEQATIEQKKEKSRNYSIWDGSFWSVMYGFGESFFSAFAIFLKATNVELSFITAFPQTIGSFFQLLSGFFINLFGSRKKMVVFFAILQGLIHIPIALVYFFGNFKMSFLILFVSLYWVFGMIAGPAWTSWMGDLVDKDKRGSYFGLRNKITSFIAFLAYVLAGFILQRYSVNPTLNYYGFLLLFTISFFARMGSVLYLSKKYEPPFKLAKQELFGIITFFKKESKTNFANLVFFLCFFNFGVYIAAPFFNAYMLNDLKFSYIEFTISTAIVIFAKILFIPVWGRAADKFGEKRVIQLTAILMPFVPLLWLFSPNFWYILAIQAFSGFVWAGFDLAVFNYILSSTEPEKRVSYVAYYNVLNGLFIFVGAIVGAYLIQLNSFFWSAYLFVFLISFFVRGIALLWFIPKLKEVRDVCSISGHRLLFYIVTSTPSTNMKDTIMPLIRRTPMRHVHFPRHFAIGIEDYLEGIVNRQRYFIKSVEQYITKITDDKVSTDKKYKKELIESDLFNFEKVDSKKNNKQIKLDTKKKK